MKKYIIMSLLLLVAVVTFGQGGEVVDVDYISVVFGLVANLLPPQTWAIIFLVAWFLEYLVTYVKWTPANSTLELVWNWFKKIVHFLAMKKK